MLAAYFVTFAADGLNAYFTPDDGGNLLHMHEYWENSLGDIAGSALRVVTGTYRPLGGIYYVVLYHLAGFHPLPFRAVCLSLMLCNLLLAFTLLTRLSGSMAAGWIGAILLARHPALLWLFYSSGTIYEVLCFLFYYSALLLYLKWRQNGAVILSWKRIVLLLMLTACALNSKEMAMTLPAALLLLELIYFPQRGRAWRNMLRFPLGRGRGIAATAILTVAVIAAKVLSHNPLRDDPRYAIHSLSSVFDAMRGYHAALLYGDLYRGLPTAGFLLLWVVTAAAGIAFRSRPIIFGLCLLIVSLAPLSVIGPRGGYMLYLPLMGWALLLGSFLVEASRPVIARAPARWLSPLRIASILAAAGVIAIAHVKLMASGVPAIHREQSNSRRIMQQMRELLPRIDGDTFLLLENDPLTAGWGPSFFTQMAYGTPRVILERTCMMDHRLSSAEMSLYDHVFSDDGVRLREVAMAPSGHPDRPIQVQFIPARVRAGEAYSVFIPELGSQTIDLAIRSVRKAAYLTVARKWCTLDPSGRATFDAPVLPAQSISVVRVRSQESKWMPASGSIELVR